MKTVNKEAIEEWIRVLRSGQYEQGFHHLRKKDETYCCLGVACDLFEDKVDATWGDYPDEYRFRGPSDKHYGVEYMPDSMVQYLGLDDRFLNDYLTTLNDDGYSFEEIADKIEEELNKNLNDHEA